MTNWPTSAGIGDTQREGKEQKFPRTRFGFATSIVDFVKHCIYVVQSKIDDWLNTFYSYKSEMKYSNDQFELLGVGDCTFTRYFKTTLTLVAVATSVLALRGENHDFSWPLMTQWVYNIGNCNRSVKPQIHLLLSDPTVMMTKMPTIMIIIFFILSHGRRKTWGWFQKTQIWMILIMKNYCDKHLFWYLVKHIGRIFPIYDKLM